jgi:hypothetical protein
MSKKIIESLNEMVADTDIRESRAANSRFQPRGLNVEDTREVFLSSCEAIAKHFAPLGYRYAKSRQHFTKQTDDLTFRISFQSSHNNVTSEYIALWVHANVESKRLKKWRSQQPHPLAAWRYLAGGQIGNLLAKPSWYEWNLASPSEREIVIKDAISTIDEKALPYFSDFKDVDALAYKLEVGEIPSLDVGNAIEFLLCPDKKTSALMHAHWFLNAHSNILPEYLKLRDEYKEMGIPKVQKSSWANSLAHVTVVYDLSL